MLMYVLESEMDNIIKTVYRTPASAPPQPPPRPGQPQRDLSFETEGDGNGTAQGLQSDPPADESLEHAPPRIIKPSNAIDGQW